MNRYAYLMFYTIGGIFSCITVGLLVWIAYCIGTEAEPLSAISFLSLPTPVVFICILFVMLVSIVSWQAGAHFQQKFEKTARKV